MSLRHFVLVGVIGIILTSCALTEDKIELTYVPQQDVNTIDNAERTSVQVATKDGRELIKEKDIDKVSAKINGFGMDMAAIRSKTDLIALLNDAVSTELSARGFQVSDTQANANIDILLTTFYNDYSTGFFAGETHADVSFTVSVRDTENNVLYTNDIRGFTENSAMVFTGGNARKSLDLALAEAVATLMDDSLFVDALFRANGIEAPTLEPRHNTPNDNKSDPMSEDNLGNLPSDDVTNDAPSKDQISMGTTITNHL